MTMDFVMMNHVNAIAMMAQNLEEVTVKDNTAKNQSQKITFGIMKSTCTKLFSHCVVV